MSQYEFLDGSYGVAGGNDVESGSHSLTSTQPDPQLKALSELEKIWQAMTGLVKHQTHVLTQENPLIPDKLFNRPPTGWECLIPSDPEIGTISDQDISVSSPPPPPPPPDVTVTIDNEINKQLRKGGTANSKKKTAGLCQPNPPVTHDIETPQPR